MDFLNEPAFWAILIATALMGFFSGRASKETDAGGMPYLKDFDEANAAFANLTPEGQSEVDQLLRDGKLINAVKRIREETGRGLKDAKMIVDARRKTLQ